MLRTLKVLWLKTVRTYHTFMLCYHDYMACKYKQTDRCGLYHGRMSYKHLSDEIRLNCKLRDIEDSA